MILSLIIGVLTVTSALPVLAAPKYMEDGNVFDAEYYGANNLDVAAVLGTDEAALYTHYVMFGKNEGRKPYADGAIPVGNAVNSSVPTIQNTGTWKVEKVKSFDVECFYLGEYTELIPARSNSTGRWQYYNHNFELQFEMQEYIDGKRIISISPGKYVDGVALMKACVEVPGQGIQNEFWMVDNTPKVVTNFGDSTNVIGAVSMKPGTAANGASHALIMRNAQGLILYTYHKDTGWKSVGVPYEVHPILNTMRNASMMTAVYQEAEGYFFVRPLMEDTIVKMDLEGNISPWTYHGGEASPIDYEADPITSGTAFSEFTMSINYDMRNGNSNSGNCLEIKDGRGNVVFRAFVYRGGEDNNPSFSYAGFLNDTYLLARPFESRGYGEYNLYRLYKE